MAEQFKINEITNLFLNIASGLKLEDLSENEINLLRKSFGDDWKAAVFPATVFSSNGEDKKRNDIDLEDLPF